ncbi:hypothetical protein M9458_027249, partial [Cirrhinus mrigala]
QESKEEEELYEESEGEEEDENVSDEDNDDYEDCVKNEDEEARGRSPTSLNFETSSSMTME